jgi:hypothetical protein
MSDVFKKVIAYVALSVSFFTALGLLFNSTFLVFLLSSGVLWAFTELGWFKLSDEIIKVRKFLSI